MIVFTAEDNGLIKTVSDQLGEYHSKAPTVLKQAINATAKDARTMLVKKAQEVYAIQTSRFNKAMKIESATNRSQRAIIRTQGKPLNIINFKVSSKAPSVGPGRPDIIKGKVLKASGMKPLEVGGRKAFVAQLKNDNILITQRRSSTRTPLKTFYAVSIPKMVGNEKTVYGEVKPQIAELLDANIRKYIDKTISKGAKA